MALETALERKELQIPATPEEMLEEYLAYKDVAVNDADKADELEKARRISNINEHASALMDLAHAEGMTRLVRQADAIRKVTIKNAEELELPLRRVTEDSRTWAMREIGKSYYEFRNPNTVPAADRDTLADPLAHDEKAKALLNKIVNSQLGREAEDAYEHYKAGWRKKIHDEHLLAHAKDIMLDESDPANPQLKNFDRTELGEALRKAIPLIRAEREMNAPPLSHGPEPRLIDTGDMPGLITPKDEHDDVRVEERTEEEVSGNETLDETKEPVENKVNLIKHPEPFTFTDAGKTAFYAGSLITLVGGALAIKEVAKTVLQAGKEMLGVFKKLFKSGFSFKALNQGVDDAGGAHGGAGAKKDAHKADHGAGHADHAGGHGHDDHGSHGADHGKAGGGHAHPAGGHDKAHGASHAGGDHGKAHAGGHAHEKKPAKKGADKKAAAHGHH